MRGGKRKGAGRKAGSMGKNNRKKMSITLPIKLVEWLKKQNMSQSKVIEKALVAVGTRRREFDDWWDSSFFCNKEDAARQAWDESALVSATIEEDFYDELAILRTKVAKKPVSVKTMLPPLDRYVLWMGGDRRIATNGCAIACISEYEMDEAGIHWWKNFTHWTPLPSLPE